MFAIKSHQHTICCRQCDVAVGKSLTFCFYDSGVGGGMHLIVKPELAASVKGITFFVEQNEKKQFRTICQSCRGNIGYEMPFGPFGCKYISIGNEKVIVDGISIYKKEKWKGSMSRFLSFELRNNDGFFGDSLNQKQENKGSELKRPALPPIFIPSSFEDFDWTLNIQNHVPRQYQLQAYIEAILQDLVLVMPTGSGKTFVAILLITRLRIMNPKKLAVFVVDRIPLVYQQASAMRCYTNNQFRVCELCSESKTIKMISRLRDNTYDVVVITAGSLAKLINSDQLRVEDFCVRLVSPY
jgi:hypothetical protein